MPKKKQKKRYGAKQKTDKSDFQTKPQCEMQTETGQLLQAQWWYKAQHSDEINFKKGTVVTFIRQDADNVGWIVVKTKLGTIGLVPAQYFRLVVPRADSRSASSSNKSSSCTKTKSKCDGKDKNVRRERHDRRVRIMQEMISTEKVRRRPHIWINRQAYFTFLLCSQGYTRMRTNQH